MGQGLFARAHANRLKIDFPNDEALRIAHEASDQARDMRSRGALNRERVSGMRSGRATHAER